MRGVLTRKGKMYLGHNPGSAYGIFAMLALVLGLAVTDIMLGQGNESVEDLHEILAYVMLAAVGAHVLGVAIHIVSHRENIIASMIHGRKDAEGSNGMSSHGITSTHRVAAALFLLVIGRFLGALIANFDRTTSTTTLPILGTQLRLAETEGEKGENRGLSWVCRGSVISLSSACHGPVMGLSWACPPLANSRALCGCEKSRAVPVPHPPRPAMCPRTTWIADLMADSCVFAELQTVCSGRL